MGYFIFAIILVLCIYSHWFAPYDSTDDAAHKKRSGLSISIDHATGVQYVGGLFWRSPRLNADGTLYTEAK